MYLYPFLQSPTPFRPTTFVETLNELLLTDPLKQQFALSCVYLDPLNDLLTYISCGFPPLIHIPQEQMVPRDLSSMNLFLGTGHAGSIIAATDNWNPGDLLIMHSLLPETKETTAPFDEWLHANIQENLLLSPQRQAEALIKKLSQTPYFSSIPFPKTAICSQRIL